MIDRYLFVELVNIVGGLVLGLNEDRVLLYSLSCGHVDGGCCKRERESEVKGSNVLMTRVCFRRWLSVPTRQDSTTYIMDNYEQLKVLLF